MSDDPNHEVSSEATLLRMLVESRREEYKELSELWRNLDTKAQGVIALTGILLAAFVAFITKGQVRPGCVERGLFVVTLLLFTGSMFAAALALRIRATVGPPYFGPVQENLQDLLQLEEPDRSERMNDLVREELLQWEECNEAVRAAVNAKTEALSWSQLLTGVSIALLALIAITIVVRS